MDNAENKYEVFSNLILPSTCSCHNVGAGDRIRNAVSGREDEVRVEDRAPAERLTIEHDQHLPGVSVGRVLDPASDNSIQVLPLEENNYSISSHILAT